MDRRDKRRTIPEEEPSLLPSSLVVSLAGALVGWYVWRALNYLEPLGVPTGSLVFVGGALGGIAAVLLLWYAHSLLLSKVLGLGFRSCLRYSGWGYFSFLLLVLLPWCISVSLPAPHDSLARKVQLLAGISAVAFLCYQLVVLIGLAYRRRIFNRLAKRRLSLFVFFVPFVWYLLFSMWTVFAGITGDEPHYLMMTHSLLYDGDLDLANNYQQEDYRDFYRRGILHPQSKMRGSRIHSPHLPGLPLLLLLPYACGGLLAVRLFLVAISALICWQLFELVLELTADRQTAFVVWLIGAFALPLTVFFTQVMPEIPATAIILISLRLMRRKAAGHRLKLHLCSVLLLSYLPWLNIRYNIFVVFGVLCLMIITKGIHRRAMLLFPAVLSYACLVVFNQALFGTPLPGAAYAVQASGDYATMLSGWWQGFAGRLLGKVNMVFFDQKYGFLFYTPVFSLSFLGLYIFIRRRSREAVFLILPFAVYLTVICGSWFANSLYRYLLPLVIPAAVGLAFALTLVKGRLFNWTFRVLSLWGFLISFSYLAVPWLRFNKIDSYNWLLILADRYSGLSLVEFFPAYQWPGALDYVITAIFWSAIIAGSICFYRRRAPSDS